MGKLTCKKAKNRALDEDIAHLRKPLYHSSYALMKTTVKRGGGCHLRSQQGGGDHYKGSTEGKK